MSSKATVQLLSVATILLILGPLVVGYTRSTTSSTTPPSSGWFHTEGRWVKDEQGNIQGLHGVNTYVTLQNEEAKFANAKTYGFNTIRLALFKQDIDDPASAPDYYADHTGLAAIDRAVGWCGKYGIKVILLHMQWADGVVPAPATFLSDTTLQQEWLNMWRLLVDRYKDDPTVVGIDLMNEPYNLQTPAGVTDPEAVWEQIAKNAITDLKTHNPNLLFIVEDYDGYAQWRDVAFLKQPNIVWSGHNYYHGNNYAAWAKAYQSGDLAGGKQLLAQYIDSTYMNYINQGIAYWEGEVGFQTSDPYWLEQMTDELQLFDERGIGFSAYTYAAWGWNEPYDLTVHSRLDFTLNTFGQIFSDHLLGLQSPPTSMSTTTSATTSTTSSTGTATASTTASSTQPTSVLTTSASSTSLSSTMTTTTTTALTSTYTTTVTVTTSSGTTSTVTLPTTTATTSSSGNEMVSTIITGTASPYSPPVNSPVAITVTLRGSWNELSGVVSNKQITISAWGNSGQCTTGQDGTCQVTFITPGAIGSYPVNAQFPGDSRFQAASASFTLSVNPVTIIQYSIGATVRLQSTTEAAQRASPVTVTLSLLSGGTIIAKKSLRLTANKSTQSVLFSANAGTYTLTLTGRGFAPSSKVVTVPPDGANVYFTV